MKIYFQIEDSRDDLKKTHNGSYFYQGLPRGMNAKKYTKKNQLSKKLKKNNNNTNKKNQ